MFKDWKSFVIWIFVLVVSGYGVTSCVTSDWYQESQRQSRVRDAAEEQPRIIRTTPDGCKVYTFKASGTYHYFTRCQATTVTEKNWTENCGKNCTRKKTEEISTENK